jgi:hypothetical protein
MNWLLNAQIIDINRVLWVYEQKVTIQIKSEP